MKKTNLSVYDRYKSGSSRYKLLTVLTTFAFLSAMLFSGTEAYAQKTRNPIRLNNVTIDQVFDQIEQNSDYKFLFNVAEVDTKRVVSVNSPDGDISNILKNIFNGTNVQYSISDHQIILSQAPVAQQLQSSQSVKGVVRGAAGEPLLGVTITIPGTSRGTTSNPDGSYSISVSPGESLRFNYLGYVPRTVTFDGGSPTINVSLEEETTVMETLVVTALGITREEKTLTYNVQKVNSDEITTVKDANIMNSLIGKVAGATITTSSSGVGGSSRVVLRGTKSLSQNNNALYVIDGIPMGSQATDGATGQFEGAGQSGDAMAMINPEDIESMSVLTGAAASALYGYQAQNGVIMINTKQGSRDGLSINLSNNTTFLAPLLLPKFQNTYGSESGSYQSWGDRLVTPSTFEPRDFFQTGYNTSSALSISHGGEKTTVYLSLGHVGAEGIIPNNEYSRYNVTFRASTDIAKNFNLDLSAMYSKVQEQNMNAQGQYSNPLLPLYLFPRGDDFSKYEIYERYDAGRNVYTQFWPYQGQGLTMQNPYWAAFRNLFENDKDRYIFNASARWKVNDWMSVTGRARLDKSHQSLERKYYSSTNATLAGDMGAYYKRTKDYQNIYGDVLVSFDKTWGDWSFNANVGASINDDQYDEDYFGGYLYVANKFDKNNIDSERKDSAYDEHYQVQSVYATAQVGWKHFLFLDVTGRNDWDSRLAGTKYSSFFYPSVGLSGIITDMLDMHSNALSFLKVRASYAEVSNAPKIYASIPTRVQSGADISSNSLYPNPSLRPERSRSWEAGLDASFWRNKIRLSATFYQVTTNHQLFDVTVSAASGSSTYYFNAGKVRNRGLEATLSLKQNIGPVDWNTNFVFSLNRNKILEVIGKDVLDPISGLSLGTDKMLLSSTGNTRTYLEKGKSMGDLYVNSLMRDENGYIYVNAATQTIAVDNSEASWIYAGNTNPEASLGWRNNFSWKGINLGFLVSARFGGIVVSTTQAILDAYGVSKDSGRARDEGGVMLNGTNRIDAQHYYQTVGGGSHGVGAMYTYDATNVRLAELSLGYDIPIGKYTKVIKGINVSFVGRNLFFFYNGAPFDPELTANTGTYYQGQDYFMSPSMRSLGFSVKLKF